MSKSPYSKNLIKVPLLEISHPMEDAVSGRQNPTQTYMSNRLVPGCDTYVEFSWIWDMPTPNPYIPEHTHDFDEIVIHIGSDADNPEDLGAEIEYVMDGEKLTIDKTSAIFIPKGVKHGPLTWKRVDRPHLEMAIILGSGDVNIETPGGDQAKIKKG
jgi:hypothetical protein